MVSKYSSEIKTARASSLILKQEQGKEKNEHSSTYGAKVRLCLNEKRNGGLPKGHRSQLERGPITKAVTIYSK